MILLLLVSIRKTLQIIFAPFYNIKKLDFTLSAYVRTNSIRITFTVLIQLIHVQLLTSLFHFFHSCFSIFANCSLWEIWVFSRCCFRFMTKFQQPFQGVFDFLCLQYINNRIQHGGKDRGQRQIDYPGIGVNVFHECECD